MAAHCSPQEFHLDIKSRWPVFEEFCHQADKMLESSTDKRISNYKSQMVTRFDALENHVKVGAICLQSI